MPRKASNRAFSNCALVIHRPYSCSKIVEFFGFGVLALCRSLRYLTICASTALLTFATTFT